jgi:hypothetical protein
MTKLVNKIQIEATGWFQPACGEVSSRDASYQPTTFKEGHTWTVKAVTDDYILLKAKGEECYRGFKPAIIAYAFYEVSDDE